MAWPIALTVDSDLLKYTFVQLIADLLEGANTFSELHKGASLEVRRWVENYGGIDDADNITNPEVFEAAAANWVIWQILRGQIEPEFQKLANEYRIEFLRQQKIAGPKTADVGTANVQGGVVATVHLIKQGDSYFTDRRSGAVFDAFRNN